MSERVVAPRPDMLGDLVAAFARRAEREAEPANPDELVYVACGGCGRPTLLAETTQVGELLLCPRCAERQGSTPPENPSQSDLSPIAS